MITYHDEAIPIFSIPPNWTSPVLVGEDWGIRAIESVDASETRRGTRPRPLYTLEYATLSLTAQEQGYIRKVLEAADDLPIGCGFWEDAIELAAPSVIGNPWIDVDSTDDTLFDVLPYMMIWGAFNSWECHRIAVISATQIQVPDSIERVWPIGTKVVPLAAGKVAKPKTKALTDINDVFRLNFQEVWLNEGPMLCQTIAGSQQGATLPFATECIGGALL